jgi:hypothetical protein
MSESKNCPQVLVIKDNEGNIQYVINALGDFRLEEKDFTKLKTMLLPPSNEDEYFKRLIDDEAEAADEYAHLADVVKKWSKEKWSKEIKDKEMAKKFSEDLLLISQDEKRHHDILKAFIATPAFLAFPFRYL